jgi:drug/metabolite transporter (DMT)-like permease
MTMHNMSRLDKRLGIKKPSKNISGILLMVLHAFAMSILYIMSKNLSQSLHPFQVAFLYKLTILIAVAPWCLYGDYKKNLKTKRIGMHVARGTFSLLGTLCFFVAVSNLTVTNAAAITYLDHILVVLIGFLYFKEKIKPAKLAMIVLSFAGAFLIIKPGFVSFNKYYIFLFLAVIFWALNCTIIKMLGATERTKAQLFYVMLFSTVFSLPMALYEWRSIELWHVKYILVIAVCYLVHSVAFFKAFKFSEMTTVMPFDYCRLIFTGILGYLVLNEIPDYYSIGGYALIILGGLYAISHETLKKSEKLTANKKLELEAEYEQA